MLHCCIVHCLSNNNRRVEMMWIQRYNERSDVTSQLHPSQVFCQRVDAHMMWLMCDHRSIFSGPFIIRSMALPGLKKKIIPQRHSIICK